MLPPSSEYQTVSNLKIRKRETRDFISIQPTHLFFLIVSSEPVGAVVADEEQPTRVMGVASGQLDAHARPNVRRHRRAQKVVDRLRGRPRCAKIRGEHLQVASGIHLNG